MTKPNNIAVRSFNVNRPVTTLGQDKQYAMPKGSAGQKFLYFFNNRFSGRGKRPFWVFASLAANVIADESVRFSGVTPGSHKTYRQSAQKRFQELWKKVSAGETVNVRKNTDDSSFNISVPVFAHPVGSLDADKSLLAYCGFDLSTLEGDAVIPTNVVTDGWSRPLVEVFKRGNVAEKDRAEWAASKAELRVAVIAGTAVFMINYRLTKEEAEFLVNEEYRFIRPMDLYGLAYEWVSSFYGQSGLSPTFSIPLRQIAQSVKSATTVNPPKPRVSEEALLINEHAEVFWLPAVLDDINRFEDIYTTAFTNEETSVFGVIDVLSGGTSGVKRKAPTPMPVFVDWVNLKFAYTNQRGRLNVMSMDRTYPVNATHEFRVLDQKVASDNVGNILSQTLALGEFYGVGRMELKKLKDDIFEYGRTYEGAEPTDIKMSDFMDYTSSVYGPPLQAAQEFQSIATKVLSRIQESPETAYARFSVPNILQLRGSLTITLQNWGKLAELKAADQALRKAYTTQGVDPDYTLPELPMVAEGRGLMPHQFKCLNISKESPNHVLYPVSAGGGKTMIYMADLLREFGHFKTPGPFMIMCPAHLVAQYVKEIVYATDGRMNAIPITSYTVRRNGLERLRTMIESAPNNTVLIVDYNVVTLGVKAMAYGTDSIRIFPVVEFLRQFGITVVYSDETHYLKSESQRQQSVHRLIADIPKKRGASGTFTADTIKDLVKQAALFDPSVFGTVDDFIKEFALETRGTKVLSWKPGTEARVKQIMKENFVYSEAKRKEWAAILPRPIERFHKVDLSERQMEVYNQILSSAVESIQAEMEKNEALRSLLNPEASADEGDEADDTTSLDQLLKPYLARMERFLTAPGKDALGATTLSGEDLVSPKARKIVELAMNHVNEGVSGKVLIFTNYKLTAEAIYEAFPDSFRDQVILYTASEKEKCGAEFENNDSKTVMVGVEVSMNTGLNLQFCSRLIRCETVWIPGTLEQGNARIGRPNIKSKEDRPEIFYDWIISNKTIDVTKVSYLMAKTISVAKYNEAGVTDYDELEVPPLFPMRIETIMQENDFDTTMLDYFGKYEAYKQVVFKEWEEYRVANKSLLFNEDGSLKLTPLVRGETPEGSALMRRVPYVPGTELYNAEQLGLIRYDAYMRLSDEENSNDSDNDNDSDSDSDEDDDSDNTNSELAEERELAKGLAVHTDRGDGEIVRVGRSRITVMLPSGEKFPVNKMAAFVITRNETSSKDIRRNLLQMVGDVPLDSTVDVLETKLTDRMKLRLERQAQREERMKERQRKADDVPDFRVKPAMAEDEDGNEVRVFNVINPDDEILETFDTRKEAREWIAAPYEGEETTEEEEEVEEGDELAMEISFTMINDMLGLRVDNHEDNDKIAALAQQYGFRYSPEYFAAEIHTPQHLLRVFKGWKEAGFTMPKDNSTVSKAVYIRMLERGRKALPSTVGFSTALDLKNFYREEFKPNPKEDTIMPYPLIQDGTLYLALPARAHPASQKAIRTVKVPGVRWMKFDSSSELILFVRTKEAALAALQKMSKDGIKFIDTASMKKQFNRLKVVRDRS